MVSLVGLTINITGANIPGFASEVNIKLIRQQIIWAIRLQVEEAGQCLEVRTSNTLGWSRCCFKSQQGVKDLLQVIAGVLEQSWKAKHISEMAAAIDKIISEFWSDYPSQRAAKDGF